jgi:hypothetical protein
MHRSLHFVAASWSTTPACERRWCRGHLLHRSPSIQRTVACAGALSRVFHCENRPRHSSHSPRHVVLLTVLLPPLVVGCSPRRTKRIPRREHTSLFSPPVLRSTLAAPYRHRQTGSLSLVCCAVSGSRVSAPAHSHSPCVPIKRFKYRLFPCHVISLLWSLLRGVMCFSC